MSEVSSNVIPFDPPAKDPPACCSFCGKPKHLVRRMVTNGQEGKGLRAICDECVEKAKRRIQEAA